MEKRGIEGIKAISLMAVALANAIDSAADKSKEGMAKALPFLELYDEMVALIAIDWSSVKEEYLDMDMDERAELSAVIKSKFDIKSDRTELIIESALDLALKLEGIVKESILLAKQLKEDSESEQ